MLPLIEGLSDKIRKTKGATMRSTFETATRFAIEEIIKNSGKETKFGVLMTNNAVEKAIDDLYALFQTSRSLKTRGDQLISGGVFGGAAKPTNPSRSL